jgi:hypothetical protein
VPRGIRPREVFLQPANYGLEVAVADSTKRPTRAELRKAWKVRQGGRPSPVLLAVGYPSTTGTAVAMCGPAGDEPPVYFDLDPSRVERLAETALAEPTRHAAQRCLLRLLPEVESELPGLLNSGLLATQELRHGVPQRADWQTVTKSSQPALKKRGRSLVEALGFSVHQLGANTSLLTAGAERRAVAVFLDEGETFEAPGARFEGVSPVSHALAVADREHLSWVVLTRASEIRLYTARVDTGVGRKGRAETFVEANLALLPEDLAGYLHLLFSAEALADSGSVDQILERSADFAADLASRLRERVYKEAVPALAQAIAARMATHPDEAALAAAYDQALNILFRLLFVAYGEDKDLLPYRTNSRYADHSLKRIARRLADDVNTGTLAFDNAAADLWEDVVQLWDAIAYGNRGWGVPPYNGGLFSADANTNPAGAALATLRLTNAEFAPALTALLVDTGDVGTVGPVDFRNLSVREFGTIYEGLLESKLSVAPTNLTLDSNGTYVPATSPDDVVVPAQAVYLHDRSGARKATGSYFTKPLAVEHLLDHALEPALADHLDRIQAKLDAGDDAAAGAAFFDFRCADIAMGSGHFLVAAIDRIEARLSDFLALHPIAAVTAELDRLRSAAYESLGELADGVELETNSLLRRQIGRRCIYGVDRNEISVELARLAIWIHTFVPGLPLSFLDHNLVVGDSLTGIGTIDEALAALGADDPKTGTGNLMREEVVGFLNRASTALKRLGTIADATVADVKAARAAHFEALENVNAATALFDLLVANRVGEAALPMSPEEKQVLDAAAQSGAHEVAAELRALHFPVAFPEVFLRDRPGFDCLLGNPPWDKVLFEPQQFWVTRVPGLNALSDAERNRAIEALRAERPLDAQQEEAMRAAREKLQQIVETAYVHRGRGHYDFAKLFVERAVSLLHSHSTLGYVLPANSLVLGGWGKLRELLFDNASLGVAQARNKGGWLFAEVHNSYSIALLARTGAHDAGVVRIWPGITSDHRLQAARHEDASYTIATDVLRELSDSIVVPWLNEAAGADLFDAMRSRPSMASGEGWVTGTHDARWDFRGSGPHRRYSSDQCEIGSWKVLMTRHVAAFRIVEGAAFQRFIPRPGQLGDGVSVRNGEVTLSADHPLVIVRHPSRNDDSRTMIATVLPASGFLHNKGYVHAVRHAPGTGTDSLLALLGFLNTFTCDWWVRRFVDRHVTAPVLNNLRLPDWDDSEVAAAARHAAALLRNAGLRALAGERALPSGSACSELEALVRLECLAAKGFGLGQEQIMTLLNDFSEGPSACPPPLRTAILEAMP